MFVPGCPLHLNSWTNSSFDRGFPSHRRSHTPSFSLSTGRALPWSGELQVPRSVHGAQPPSGAAASLCVLRRRSAGLAVPTGAVLERLAGWPEWRSGRDARLSLLLGRACSVSHQWPGLPAAQGPVVAITSHWRCSLRRSLPDWLGFTRKVTFSSEPPTAMGMLLCSPLKAGSSRRLPPEWGGVRACEQRVLPGPLVRLRGPVGSVADARVPASRAALAHSSLRAA